jgi:hypothetical protein
MKLRKNKCSAFIELKGYVTSEITHPLPKSKPNLISFNVSIDNFDDISAGLENNSKQSFYRCNIQDPCQVELAKKLIKKHDYVYLIGKPLCQIYKNEEGEIKARTNVDAYRFEIFKNFHKLDDSVDTSVHIDFNNDETFMQQQDEIKHFF